MASQDGIVRAPQVSLPPPAERFGKTLLHKIQSRGDAVAQVYPLLEKLTVTCAELARRAVCVSLELESRGVKTGDLVVLVAYAPPAFLPLFTGCALQNAVLAPVNPQVDEGDIRSLIRDTMRPALVIAEESVAGRIRKVCPELQVVELTEVSRWFERHLTDELMRRAVPDDPPGWIDMPVLVMCSSGTTGPPKGVVHSNRTLLTFLTGLGAVCGLVKMASGVPPEQQPDLALLQVSGVFWISGVSLQIAPVVAGGQVIVVPGADNREIVNTVEEYKVNMAFISPNQVISLAKSGLASAEKMSSLKFVMVGGFAMDGPTQLWAEKELGIKLSQFIAMTETLTLCLSGPHLNAPAGSVGKLVTNLQAKVVDPESGKVLGPNQDGELWYKTPTLMKEYLSNPEETAKVIDQDGWFHSGDIGHYDEEGYFFITDRIKNIIKYKGHHVNPSELEGRLLMHPAVLEATVIGAPHETDQEHPIAFVVLRPGSKVAEHELVDFVNDNVTDIKRLRGGVRFLEQLPRTPTGKVKTRQLRDSIKGT